MAPTINIQKREFLKPTSLEENLARKSPTPKLKADKIPSNTTIFRKLFRRENFHHNHTH